MGQVQNILFHFAHNRSLRTRLQKQMSDIPNEFLIIIITIHDLLSIILFIIKPSYSLVSCLTWKFTTYSRFVLCTLIAKGSVG